MAIFLEISFLDVGECEKYFEDEKACLEYIQKNINVDMVESISIEDETGDLYVDGYTDICLYLNEQIAK